jgi:hypothetical protein
MQAVTTIGLDIAKSVFQLHGVDEHMGAPTNPALARKVLANSEPSTHGGKAD